LKIKTWEAIKDDLKAKGLLTENLESYIGTDEILFTDEMEELMPKDRIIEMDGFADDDGDFLWFAEAETSFWINEFMIEDIVDETVTYLAPGPTEEDEEVEEEEADFELDEIKNDEAGDEELID